MNLQGDLFLRTPAEIEIGSAISFVEISECTSKSSLKYKEVMTLK